MAHKKGAGSSRIGRDSEAKRLGVKAFAVKAVKTFAADKLVAAGIDIDAQAVDAAIPASIAGAVGAITPYLSTEGLDVLSEADSMWKGGANPFKVEKVAGDATPIVLADLTPAEAEALGEALRVLARAAPRYARYGSTADGLSRAPRAQDAPTKDEP